VGPVTSKAAPSATDAAPQQRRRGKALEDALLDAAWNELIRAGYSAMTMESVAAQAQTSRPVLYRRWGTKAELVMAALHHYDESTQVSVPNTGSFREDIIELMREGNRRRSALAAVMSIQMAGFYEETGATPADLRERLLGGRTSSLDVVVERAAERGEIDATRLTARMKRFPFDLFRNELMMRLEAVPERVILEIVDDIYLPLVMKR